MQAAIPLLARQGYRGASLAAIAAAVDMSQPGVLHHFPSKEQLLLAVLAERDRDSRQRVADALAGAGLDPLAALTALVAYNQTIRELVQLFTVLVGEAVAEEHPAHRHFVDRYQTIRGQVLDLLRRGQASGSVREDIDLEAIVPVILAVMDGLQIQWLLDPEIDMVRGFRAFADMLRAQLATAPGTRPSGEAAP
jgi:AcrR family transcriptional regulator